MGKVLGAPDHVSIFGDRRFRVAVLGSLMATAALSFGLSSSAQAPAPAAAVAVGTASAVSAPLFNEVIHSANAAASTPTGVPDLPVTDAAAGALARRDGLFDVAHIAVTVTPQVYPLAFRAGMDESEIHERVVQFVFSKPIAEPEAGQGGYLGAQNDLEGELRRSLSPLAWNYVTKTPDVTGCVIMMSNQHVQAVQGLAAATGMPVDVARDFAVMHEEAHCAQTGEKLAAIYDIPRLGAVRPDRVAGGMLGANMERLLAAGLSAQVVRPGFLDEPREQLSAERFADGFAMVALLAQQRLSGQELNGLIAWRLGDDSKHNTASFLGRLRADLQKDPELLASMRSKGEPGFDAAAIAAFLRPQWRAFELAELAGERGDVAHSLARPSAAPAHLRQSHHGWSATTASATAEHVVHAAPRVLQ